MQVEFVPVVEKEGDAQLFPEMAGESSDRFVTGL